jgi:acyl-CoA reductase-like NAD-dependent aldehyde dehydrogenase
LLVLLGRDLVRAGRGRTALLAATAFAVVFALSVQPFLFRWPDWMVAYATPAASLPPGRVALPFFVAVAGAGLAGAYVSLRLLENGRAWLAVLNAGFGLFLWATLWSLTWDEYFHVGTWAEYHEGRAVPLALANGFSTAMNVAGLVQAVAGLGLAAFVVTAGRRARATAAVQPDPVALDWRGVAEGPVLAGGPAPAVVEGGRIAGIRPVDGLPLAPILATPVPDVPAAIERARAAQVAWARLPVRERARRVATAGKLLLASSEEAARLIEAENGRPVAESYFFELIPNDDLFRYWTRRAETLLRAEAVPIDPLAFPAKRGVVERVPRGVVLVVSPWNLPLSLPLRPAIPALLAGNAVVLKPSEHTARCGALLGRIFGELLPPGVFQVIQGGGEVAQAAIEAGVDFVSFTGSPRTGRLVAEAAARRLTPVGLELGGKDAAIVLADADLERAANGIVWGAFANAGQNCAAVERCYVVREVADRFLALLRERMAALRPGPGGEGAVDVGPLTTPAQQARVLEQLREARERGADVTGGERAGPGLWVHPALVVDPPEELALVREESFGPVLPVFRVADPEEAVRRANASAYGLTASVWTRDLRAGERLARRLQAGVITVNNHAFTGGIPGAPWSGVRGSGAGVTNGPEALRELTRPRFVLVDRSRRTRELWWHPYDATAVALGRGMLRLRGANGHRFAALRQVLGAARKRR